MQISGYLGLGVGELAAKRQERTFWDNENACNLSWWFHGCIHLSKLIKLKMGAF